MHNVSSPYKRRKPLILHRLWISRYLIAAAFVLGVTLWFMFSNRSEVSVAFPFGLGTITSKLGIVILLSFIAGSLTTALAMTVFFAMRKLRGDSRGDDGYGPPSSLPDDRPPTDYGAKTSEGFTEPPWTR
ncbi:MAG: hypothetical protein NVSMB14_07480 [Isosphaeraceae bacterium]